MISEAEELERLSRVWAEDKLAELQATWRAEVEPKLSVVLATMVHRLEDHGTAVAGQELADLLENAGLEHTRGRASSVDQFFFPEWVRQTTPESVPKLRDTMTGNRSPREALQLRGKGQALLALLEPIVSDEVTTSWLDRSGFNGTWTGL